MLNRISNGVASVGVAFVLASCASQQPNGSTPVTVTETREIPYRYLSFVEGDYQTGYQPNRTLADSEIERLRANPPQKKDTEKYLGYLSALLASNQRGEAEKRIKEYLAEYPNERRAAFLLGVAHLRSKKNELAQYFFAQLEKDPKFPWKSLLYNNLGLMALEEKNRPVALSYFEKATKSDPRIAAPFVNLGSLYLQSRSYGDAEKMFEAARDIDSGFEDAALGLGVAMEGQGRFDEAHAVYKDFLGDHPNALSVLFNDAVILGSRLGKKEEGSVALQRYLERGGKETARANEVIRSWR